MKMFNNTDISQKTQDDELRMFILDKRNVSGNLADFNVVGTLSDSVKSLNVKPKDFNMYIDGSVMTIYDRTSRKLEHKYNRIIIIVD